MKCFLDEYGIFTSHDDVDVDPWILNIAPVDRYGPSEGWKEIIEVTEEERNEFIAIKKRLREMQDMFYNRWYDNEINQSS
jgi:hypothetical protein